MQERKSQFYNNYLKFKTECDRTCELLRKFCKLNQESVQNIEERDEEWLIQHPKYILDQNSFQNLLYYKLLTINLHLEVFYNSVKNSENASISGCQILENTNTSFSESNCFSSSLKQPNIPLYDNISPEKQDEQNTLLIEIDTNETKVDFKNIVNEININLDNKEDLLVTQENSLLEDEPTFKDSFKETDVDVNCSIVKCESDNTSKLTEDADQLKTSPSQSLPITSEHTKTNKGFKKTDVDVNCSIVKCESDNTSKLTDEENQLKTSPSQSLPITSEHTKSDKVLEEPKLPKIGDCCMITHFISPSHFYIQVGDEQAADFDEMEQKLNLYYHSSTLKNISSKLEAQKYFGKYCACLINEKYYRIEIINWLEKENIQLFVKLVDYGNIESVPFENLRILEDCFYEFPKIAQRCHFESLYPAGSTCEKKLAYWPAEATKAVMDAVGDFEETVLQIYILNIDQNEHIGHSIGLDLVKVESNEKSLGQYLIDRGYGVEVVDVKDKEENMLVKNAFMREQIKTIQGLAGIDSNMSNDEMFDVYFKNDTIEEYENVNEAVMAYNPQDEAKTCPFQNKDGTCFKGKRCKLRHTVLPRDGYTADKEPVYISSFNEFELPAPNTTVTVRITSVLDIQRFYVQIIRNIEVENPLEYKEFTLRNLIKRMNDLDMIRSYKKFKNPPALCEIVIAKHSWDGNWYRGRVCEILQNDKGLCSLQVFTVDFGEILNVDLKNVRKIIPEFLELPFQAIECHFHNITHGDGTDSEMEKKFFEEGYMFERFIARIIDNIGHLKVLLFDDKGQDIGNKLVESGVGQFKKENIIPNRNNRLLID